MKIFVSSRLAVLGICFMAYSFSAVSQEKISFTWKGGTNRQFGFSATNGKQYTVDWGDGSAILTRTGQGGSETPKPPVHNYANSNIYIVTVTGLEDCFFLLFGPVDNELTSLDLSQCTSLTSIYCRDNHLPLSDLYAASELISDSSKKLLGTQTLATQIKNMGDTVDFSTQTEFGGILTCFAVDRNGSPASRSDYTIIDGVITFTNTGYYKITMTNDAIVSHESCPAQVIAEVNVLESNASAALANLTVLERTLTPTFNPAHYEYTVSVEPAVGSIVIVATPYDTKATVNGGGYKMLSDGTNQFIITVTAVDGKTTSDYTINVIREGVGINELTIDNGELRVFPNPTSGQLRVTSYKLQENTIIEIYDVLGRKAPFNSPEGGKLPSFGEVGGGSIVIDVKHLPSGMYFLKVQTSEGVITNKIIKN